jgi:methylmalonyl-CoA mutase
VVTADDLARALADIDLARTPLFVEAGPAVGPLLSLLAASLQVKGLSPFIIKGVVAADPLGELAASGRLSCSIESLYI